MVKKERIESIDSLKGIACLVIAFLWHYLNMQSKSEGMPFQSIFGAFYNTGQYFVELFFMISGFVMAYCYREKIEGDLDLFSYLVKRYKHLYPMFFNTLLSMLFLQSIYYAIMGSYYVYKISPWHFILNILCIQTGWFTTDQSFNGPAWCISVEIFLYLMYYITTRFAKKDKNCYLIINICVMISALALLYVNNGMDVPFLNAFMLRGISCFYIGVNICELNQLLEIKKRENISNQLLIAFLVFRIALYFSPYEFWTTERVGQFLLILLEWPIILFVSINCKLFRKILEIKPLIYLGNISMDIFLWHVPVQITLKIIDKVLDLHINYGLWYVWLFYVIIVMIVAIISNIMDRRRIHNYYLFKFISILFATYAVLGVVNIMGIQLKSTLDSSLEYSDLNKIVTFDPDVTITEEFAVKKDTCLQKIQFYTITWGRQYDENQLLNISIVNLNAGGDVVFSVSRRLADFRDAAVCEIPVENPVMLQSNSQYEIKISSNTTEGQNTMALMLTTDTKNNNEGAFVNGEKLDKQHIALKLWTKDFWLPTLY